MKLLKNDKSARMSVPKARDVHGVTIQKVPVGRYIAALKEMESLPALLLQDCFPGQTLEEVLQQFTVGSQGALLEALTRLLTIAPEHVIDAFCAVLGVEKAVVMEQLTPNELLDVLTAFWEVNDLSDFFRAVWQPVKRQLATLTIGSSGGSPSRPVSV